MASTSRSKSTGRSAAKTAAKARPGKTGPAIRAMRGLVKVSRAGLVKASLRAKSAARKGAASPRKPAAKVKPAKVSLQNKPSPKKMRTSVAKAATGRLAKAPTDRAKASVAEAPMAKAAGADKTKRSATALKGSGKEHLTAAPKAATQRDSDATGPRSPSTEPRSAIDLAREKELAREHGSTAVNRALSLLETLARTGPVPLAVLADAAGCGKSAALDLLTTMQNRNFVIQDGDHGLWRLGARWAVLGSAASEQGALAATAMPYLAALGNATGENVYLRVREGMECETVAIYQTDPGLRVYTEVGKKMPLHAGSGRLLLAHAPEAVQTQVLAQRLQRYTPSTRTDPSWIAADLHRIRQRGFLITDSEVVAGTVSVAAAVRDASGQVVAAILIGAPSLRMRPPRPRALMPAVVEAARKLSYALGSISEQPASTPAISARPSSQLGAFTSSAWPTTALGATISRPHSIFR